MSAELKALWAQVGPVTRAILLACAAMFVALMAFNSGYQDGKDRALRENAADAARAAN